MQLNLQHKLPTLDIPLRWPEDCEGKLANDLCKSHLHLQLKSTWFETCSACLTHMKLARHAFAEAHARSRMRLVPEDLCGSGTPYPACWSREAAERKMASVLGALEPPKTAYECLKGISLSLAEIAICRDYVAESQQVQRDWTSKHIKMIIHPSRRPSCSMMLSYVQPLIHFSGSSTPHIQSLDAFREPSRKLSAIRCCACPCCFASVCVNETSIAVHSVSMENMRLSWP